MCFVPIFVFYTGFVCLGVVVLFDCMFIWLLLLSTKIFGFILVSINFYFLFYVLDWLFGTSYE